MKVLLSICLLVALGLFGCAAPESAPNDSNAYASPDNPNAADDAAIQQKLDETQQSNSRSATGK